MSLKSPSRSGSRSLHGVDGMRWLVLFVVVVALAVAGYLLLSRSSGSTVNGSLFADHEGPLTLAPDGSYSATVQAVSKESGIARYELAVDSRDGRGYVVKDTARIDCSNGCPKEAPARRLVLSASFVPSGKSRVRVRAVDSGGGVAFSRTRPVAKDLSLGIQEPRLGRPKPGSDPDDVSPHAVFGDRDFNALRPRYFRLFVSWDRLEPRPDVFDWDADVGGGRAPPAMYRSTVDSQIGRARRLGMKVIVTFQHTPCWAQIRKAVPPSKEPCERNEFGRLVSTNLASWPDPDRGIKRKKSMIDEYKDFVAAFVERYSGPRVEPDKRIKLYTAWNEPNNFGESQPQICGQSHTDPERFPDFAGIRCPEGKKPGEVVSADYYMMLYNRLYDSIYRDYVPGMPGVKFDPSIQLLPGDTADFSIDADAEAKNVDEAEFTMAVVEGMTAAKPPRCPSGPWAKHAFRDIRYRTFAGVRWLQRLLDGLDPDTGKRLRGLDTQGCTKDIQIWVTEAAALYKDDRSGGKAEPPCKLHAFLDGAGKPASWRGGSDTVGAGGRVDVFIQYLFQTDPGYDSGLLSAADSDGDGRLDRRPTYLVLRDWSLYLSGKKGRPKKSNYRDSPFNCR